MHYMVCTADTTTWAIALYYMLCTTDTATCVGTAIALYYALVKIQCIVGASLSIIYKTSHRVIAHKHVSCACHESNLQALR